MLRLRLGARMATGLAVWGAAWAVLAQEQATPTPQAALAEVIVTGSRIRRIDDGAATVPIISVSSEELNDQGDVSLGEALNDLPALRATFNQANSSRFIGTAGLNWLDLRGLGVERTLVLVNNRRHVTSSPGDYYVDVNTIPTDLVERVDLVTGGNSAVYGSDAVAGVVNFVTRRDFEGLRLRAQSGVSSEGDRRSDFLSLTAGRNSSDGRGNIALALEWDSSDALYYRQRESLTGAFSGRRFFALSEDSSDDPDGSDGIVDNLFYDGGLFDGTLATGGVVAGAASGDPGSMSYCGLLSEPARSQRCLPNNEPRIFSFDASGNLVETIPDIDLRPFGTGLVRIGSNPGGLTTRAETGQLLPGLDRYSANLLAHLDVSDAFRPFLEAKFVHVDAVMVGGPSFWRDSILGFFEGGTELKCNNPFLSSQAQGVLQTLGRCETPDSIFEMSRLNVDFGSRGELHDRDTWRVVAGFEGELSRDLHYEVAVNYGRLDTRLRSLNNLLIFDLEGNPDGFLLAIDAVRNAGGEIVCGVNADEDPSNDRPDCMPLDVFGPGAPSQAAVDFVNTTGIRNETAEQFVASAYLSGNLPWPALPAGPIGFALGLEYRTEEARSVFDELTAAGATFQNEIEPFLPPDLSIMEAFAELRIPLLHDRRLAHELTFETAGRISDYDTATGSVSAHNLGLVYAPLPELRFRVNFSTSVRAPTQGDLYRPFSQDFAFVADPCDVLHIRDHRNRAANCAEAGVPPNFPNTFARENQITFETGGNPRLVEEEGESITFGAHFTPVFLPGLSLSIDYFDIEVTNLIAPPNAQAILNACYDSPSGIANNPYCAVIHREEGGLFETVALTASGFNYARQVTEGLDLDATYATSLPRGHQLSGRVLATRILELNNYLELEDPSFADRVLGELGDPEFAFNFDLDYTFGHLSLGYSLRYVGGQTIGFYEEQHAFNGNPPTDADAYARKWYPSAYIHGIRGDYAVGEKVNIYAGVDNLTNSLPPLGLVGDFPGEQFDGVGRYFYLGVTIDL